MGNKQRGPDCYLDIQIGEAPIKRIRFQLFYKDCPKTCENFRALCTGEKTTPTEKLHFKESYFHRCEINCVAQGGDFTKGDGTGGKSIYGKFFKDENFIHKHYKRGMLSMANCGKDTNGSQFFITYSAMPVLDGKHVVFGMVVDGFDCLDDIEKVSTLNGFPSQSVEIVRCGIFSQ